MEESLAAVERAYNEAHRLQNLVGNIPPSPSTFRARIGLALVSGVQRMLFWYTPQIQRYQSAATSSLKRISEHLHKQLEFHTDVEHSLRDIRKEIIGLQAELRRTGNSRHMTEPLTQPADILPDAFTFLLLERFRGPEDEVRRKLRPFIEIVSKVHEAWEGPWVDAGCGRGEWLELATASGREAVGVDSNPLAVAHCHEKHLTAIESDVLEHVVKMDPCSTGLITAFHVLEHWPLAKTIHFLDASMRVLKPGGLLIVELPNPENLLSITNEFWLDPTHHRPVPQRLLELSLAFCGFVVLQSLNLEPHDERDRIPFNELPFVQNVSRHFHGPEAYALVAQKPNL